MGIRDLVGSKIGKLRILSDRILVGEEWFHLCECECGNKKLIRRLALTRKKHTASCGCIASDFLRKLSTSHGMSKHPLYGRYAKMLARCYNPRDPKYGIYGGRGITVCDRWKGDDGFKNFVDDMKECPKGKTLGRVDNNGPYSPDNCRFETLSQQARNKRDTVMLSYNGITKPAIEWAEDFGLNPDLIKQRVKNGWDTDMLLTTPNGSVASRKLRGTGNDRILYHKGESHSVTTWARLLGINKNTLQARLTVMRWSVEDALNTPVGVKRKRGI